MDTSEARYGEMARKMVELDQWVVPMFTYDEPFWGKPPLSLWGFSVGIEVFGSCLIGYKATGAVLTDPSLLFCMTLALVGFWRGFAEKRIFWFYSGSVGLGLALLAKGPVSTVLIAATIFVWLVWKGEVIRFLTMPSA